MSPSRFRQIERLYHAARELPANERARFLDGACAGDDELRREIESLLAQDVSGSNSLGPRAEDLDAPAFAAGDEIGCYRIESQLGEGGMGVVYKAFDKRLNRFVAVKLLSDRLADTAARRRFQREAQTASSLNHPHIVTVYDAGDLAGRQYLVTEYIDGGTLREWAQGGGRTWRETVELLTGVADGLATAHEAKILHRDIKPANILVMKSGYAKLADFGLAKLAEGSSGRTDRAETVTEQTRPGMVLGTIAYMSPEQARGKAIDARSDIFSFGVVLYELLEGRRPFDGETELETLHKIIGSVPPALGDQVPATLRAVVEKALQKDPGERYQSMRDMVADLRAIMRTSEAFDSSPVKRPVPETANRARGRAVRYSAAAAAVLLAAAGAWRLGDRGGPVAIPAEFVQLTNFSDYATAPAISRDGTMLAFFRAGSYFLGGGQVYVKLLRSGESKQLTDDPSRKYGPVFTPDGSRVAYTVFDDAAGAFTTWTVPVFGGPPSRLMNNAAGLSWLEPDRVLFSEIMPGTVVHMGIVTARESRADERRIYFPAHQRGMAHYSYASPDRRSVLLVEMDKSQDWQPCRLVPMDGKSSGSQVGPSGACTAAGWSPDGKWMYFNVTVAGGSHLWRQRYPDGSPEQITFGPTEEEGLAVAPDGKSLITSLGVRQSSVWLKDAAGDHRLPAEGPASEPRFSADGQRLYYLVKKVNAAGAMELWARDLAGGRADPILTGQNIIDYDISQDQKSVVFSVEAGGSKSIFVAAVDRGSPPRLLTKDADEASFAGPTEVVFRQLGEKSNYLARLRIDGTGLERILNSPIAEKSGTSPDGRWVSVGGISDPSKKEGTYIISLQDRTARYLANTPCVVQWSLDGKLLFVTLSETAGDQRTTAGSHGRTLVVPLPRGLAEAAIPEGGFDGASDEPPNGIRVIREWRVAARFDDNSYAYTAAEFQGNLFRIPLHVR
jgi:serine/threonine protein kinase/Tol biopolymer transport system component